MRPFAAVLALVPVAAQAVVLYSVRPDIGSSSFIVSIQVEDPKAKETFQIPGWSPGFYVMQHYEKTISDVRAIDPSHKRLTVQHPDDRTWTVSGAQEGLVLSYRVSAKDVGLGFFGANITSDSAYYNGPSLYMYAAAHRGEEDDLNVSLPEGWKLATALDKKQADSAPTWTAGDYDEFADCPVQMGKFVDRKFAVRGIPFEAVFLASPDEKINFDIDGQADVVKRVSAPAIDMFGGAPFKRYLYIFHLTSAGFQGGLEHRSGCVLAVANVAGQDISDLVAHEEFHAWNVKQIRPKLLGPFDYTKPQRTGALWFCEGVTDYYAKLNTYRSGVHGAGWLLDQLGSQVEALQAGRTRLTKTVEDASRAVWENGGFNLGDLDYYNKGLLAGLIFDADIRSATNGAHSLDDVMRLMYRRYRLPKPGYDEDDIMKAINEVAQKDLTSLYTSMIRSSAEMPYADLQTIGLQVLVPNGSAALPGGWPMPSDAIPGDALQRLGLNATDKFEDFLPSDTPGNALMQIDRGGTTVQIKLPLQNVRADRYELVAIPDPTAEESQRLANWLKRTRN